MTAVVTVVFTSCPTRGGQQRNQFTLNLTGTDDDTSQESSEEETVMEEADKNQAPRL